MEEHSGRQSCLQQATGFSFYCFSVLLYWPLSCSIALLPSYGDTMPHLYTLYALVYYAHATRYVPWNLVLTFSYLFLYSIKNGFFYFYFYFFTCLVMSECKSV